jgi:hypothetical protein
MKVAAKTLVIGAILQSITLRLKVLPTKTSKIWMMQLNDKFIA